MGLTSYIPAQPQWYAEPKQVHVRYERIAKAKETFFGEYAVEIRVNGETQTALVPADAVDESQKTVVAYEVGELQDNVFIYLPPSSMGRTVLQIKKSRLADIVFAA